MGTQLLPFQKRELSEIHPGIFAHHGHKPIEIDFDYYLKRRPKVLDTIEEMPQYLLLPEVLLILRYAQTDQQHFFLNTLWNTGARPAEALSLKPSSFTALDDTVYVKIETAKRGRPAKKRKPKRWVPIMDQPYLDELKRYIKTRHIHKQQRLFGFTDRTARNWVYEAIKNLERDGHQLTIEGVNLKSFRHSYAINLVLSGTYIKYIQKWMGHKSMQSTEVYTNVLTLEGEHYMERTRFS